MIGVKERNRPRALQIEPGDRIVLYLTKVMSFAGSILVTGDIYEDRKPEIVLKEDQWVPAETLATKLDHIKKWPAEHWKLAFQGQLRTVSEKDAKLLLKRMSAAADVQA